MTQPSFVPIGEADQIRPALRLEASGTWSPDRPADLRLPAMPAGRGFGKPGPDQGFALRVARAFADRIVLTKGEELEDALVGCALMASRRAGAFGRAPSAPDLKWAMTLWGFFEASPPPDLLATRVEAFRSLSHDYVAQRALVDRIPVSTLPLRAEQVAGRDDRIALLGY